MKFLVVTSGWGNIICILKADNINHSALKKAIEEYHGMTVTFMPDFTWIEGEGEMTFDVEGVEESGEDCIREITLVLAHLYE